MRQFFFSLCSASRSGKLLKESFFLCLMIHREEWSKMLRNAPPHFLPNWFNSWLSFWANMKSIRCHQIKHFLLIDKLSKHCLLQKPFFFLHFMQKGVKAHLSSICPKNYSFLLKINILNRMYRLGYNLSVYFLRNGRTEDFSQILRFLCFSKY